MGRSIPTDKDDGWVQSANSKFGRISTDGHGRWSDGKGHFFVTRTDFTPEQQYALEHLDMKEVTDGTKLEEDVGGALMAIDLNNLEHLDENHLKDYGASDESWFGAEATEQGKYAHYKRIESHTEREGDHGELTGAAAWVMAGLDWVPGAGYLARQIEAHVEAADGNPHAEEAQTDAYWNTLGFVPVGTALKGTVKGARIAYKAVFKASTRTGRAVATGAKLNGAAGIASLAMKNAARLAESASFKARNLPRPPIPANYVPKPRRPPCCPVPSVPPTPRPAAAAAKVAVEESVKTAPVVEKGIVETVKKELINDAKLMTGASALLLTLEGTDVIHTGLLDPEHEDMEAQLIHKGQKSQDGYGNVDGEPPPAPPGKAGGDRNGEHATPHSETSHNTAEHHREGVADAEAENMPLVPPPAPPMHVHQDTSNMYLLGGAVAVSALVVAFA